jgi:hypothetical protein
MKLARVASEMLLSPRAAGSSLVCGSEDRKTTERKISAGALKVHPTMAALNAACACLTEPRANRSWNGIAGPRLTGRVTRPTAIRRGPAAMKLSATLLAVAALTLAANTADAKGCLKGAVVGGVAGHYAGHHAVLGAIAGCAYGRHHAKEQARQQHDTPAAQPNQPPAGQEKL